MLSFIAGLQRAAVACVYVLSGFSKIQGRSEMVPLDFQGPIGGAEARAKSG